MKRYRADIDGLRALAVIPVLIFHFFPSLLPGGFVGVDVFFVISGFLITSIIINDVKKGTFTVLGFYKKRIIRIFPALTLVLSTVYLLGWFSFLQGDFASLGKHIFGGSFFISNLLLWSESGYFDTSSQLKPLLHLWSLGVEEQFYLFWPLLLILFAKTKRALYLTSLAILVISFMVGLYTMHSTSGSNYYSPLSRFWELMFGAILAGYKANEKVISNKKLLNLISISGMTLLIASILFINDSMPFPGYIAIFPVTGATMLILSNGGVCNKILSLKPLVFIGLISYPLYLWHWPIYSSSRILLASDPTTGLKILLIAICFLLAYLTYKFIEHPVRFGAKRPVVVVSLFSSVFALGIIGLITFRFDGIQSRSINGSIGEYTSITDPYTYFEFKKNMRMGLCHSVDKNTEIENGCISHDGKGIMLWGDSYAAALYKGLEKITKDKNIGITQSTDGNGPPFFIKGKLTDTGKDLLSVNTHRLEIVRETKPKIVLLAWMIGGYNSIGDMGLSVDEIRKTTKLIKSASPLTKVIVIGPVPEWNDSLLKQVVYYYKSNKKLPPTYMKDGLNPGVKIWDEYYKKHITMKSVGAEYISSYDAMCIDEACLTRIKDHPKDLVTIDWGHLSKAGSDFLMDSIKNNIL
ncbi:acyltransferase [Citrobacter freundii]|uniref:acyltransferase family protein n=1 Tax=Citrobacter freundii TaxID=546 RepID=UPI003978F532|nr:acyltransferase [Citrobacter freundii]